MVRFLEEVLAGKFVFDFYWPLVSLDKILTSKIVSNFSILRIYFGLPFILVWNRFWWLWLLPGHLLKQSPDRSKNKLKTGLTETDSQWIFDSSEKELCSHNRISFEVKINLNSKFFQIAIWYDMKKIIKTDKLLRSIHFPRNAKIVPST